MSIRTAGRPPHGTARAGVVLRTAAATWYQDGPDAPLLRIPTGSAPAPVSAPGAGAPPDAAPEGAPAAVLFDRDGTLIEDVPHNTDPARVRARPHAAEAMRLLEAAGTRAAVVTNQPDIGRGLLTLAQLEALHARMAELLGPIEVTAVCPHIPGAGCGCRKPAPGLVHAVCRVLGLPPGRTVVVGDIGTDLLAAHHAGAPGLLVPNEATRPEETDAAPHTAGHLASAVRTLLGPAHGAASSPANEAPGRRPERGTGARPGGARAHPRSRPGGLG
ncbi:D-glycero-alpha-D-manno-heptose-1,7-bisphosphate 7-phosphatase [Streptomyces diacarni]|uniref:D-glycero-alpha-D-manno-heptose-1,7-bisphosphate 7-phosphatase n=1 Tax=Streptomyces diacarni TaxID=2800381 RepID=UPI001FE6F00C|nr:HAD-IIIA family hydrolase [Streptomyces diacarni]